MKEHLEILRKWVATGQVKTARGRQHDDLLTLIGQMEVTLRQQPVSGSLLAEIKSLLEQYRDEEMSDWNTPFHYDAEGWAAMKYFIEWLERKKK
jgi:hypothetical protein